jgi:hypothetical protein
MVTLRILETSPILSFMVTLRLLKTSPIFTLVVTLRLLKSLLFFSLVVVLMMLRDSQSSTKVENRILDVRQSRTHPVSGISLFAEKKTLL